MQKEDADFLLQLVQMGEEVVVRLTPGLIKEAESGKKEAGSGNTEVDALVSRHLEELLAQDTSTFTDAMRNTMAKEMLKLNSELSSADSALAKELLNLKTLGVAESAVTDRLKEAVAQKLYKMKKGLNVADSAYIEETIVDEDKEEEGHRHSDVDTSIGGSESNVDGT